MVELWWSEFCRFLVDLEEVIFALLLLLESGLRPFHSCRGLGMVWILLAELRKHSQALGEFSERVKCLAGSEQGLLLGLWDGAQFQSFTNSLIQLSILEIGQYAIVSNGQLFRSCGILAKSSSVAGTVRYASFGL